jgi:putative DNA primase/helicase
MNNENTTAIEAEAAKEVSELTPVGSFKEIAMPLVARGIPVIPIPPRQKGAALKGWQNLATTELEQIEKWNEENPQYNAGVVAKLNGFWMLDCDVPDLPQTIEKETAKIFPQTFSVRSNKGLHFYFKHTAASQSLKKNIQLKDEQGNVLCDVKVHNGYVVGPGSIHPSGTRYEVVNDAEISDAPDWLVTWIREQHKHGSEADEQEHGASEGKIKEGGRDNFLFKQACKLHAAELSKSAALTALLSINSDTCDPPMEDAVVQLKIESAYSYEPTNNALHELIEKPDLPSHTDLGNAQRLVAAEGNNIRYCYKNNSWFIWDDRMWSKDESGEIHRVAKRTVKAMLHEAADLDDEHSKILVTHEQRSESEGRLNAMVSLARSEPGVFVRLVDFDADPMLFNCLNATIDLSTAKPREHCRADLISKIAPVEYESTAECPTWRDFLHTVTDGDTELAEYLQRCVGYSLTGQTREHALFLLYGTGANGKSTFLEALRHVFGDYSQTADFGSFLFSNGQSVRNDLAKLNGARFVTANESDSGKRLDETVVKQMTGGDTVTARFLYGEHFEFTPQFKLWLGTNHKPTIRGQDEGVWRRIRLIPFTVSIPRYKQDHTLKDKLKLEAPGILNWALEGLAQWQANGLQEPVIVKNATKEYRADQDVIGHFLDARCTKEAGLESPARELYQAYKQWAEQTGEWVLNERVFSNVLAERGFKKVRQCAGNVWKGIATLPGEMGHEPPHKDYF